MAESDGAIDNDWEAAERSAEEVLREEIAGYDHELSAGDVAIDLVMRRPLFVYRKKADTLVKHYEEEGFDLFSYKYHPYLAGVRKDDCVYECCYITGDPKKAHKTGQMYDFPEGRLMKVPVAEAWAEESDA